MRQNSFYTVLLVFINIIAIGAAVWFAVDAADAARMQSARTDLALGRLTAQLDKINTTLARLQTQGLQAASSAPAAGAPFANDDLRDPAAEEGGSMYVSTQSLPGSLNGTVTNEATISEITGLVLDTLGEPNNNDLTRYEPKMAESWEVSPDGLEYTIHLRRNVLWQPYVDPVDKREVGARPVTSADFLFYWQTIQNPKIPCEAIRTYYQMLDRIDIIDDYTFKVVWKEPYSLAETFTLGLSPLPKHYYRPDPSWDDARFADEFTTSARNQWLIGTGPYKLASWDKNREVVLERDENYYGPKPAIKERRILLMPDPSVSFLEFKRGRLDRYGLLPAQWHEETPEPDFKLVTPSIDTAWQDSKDWDARKRAKDPSTDCLFEKYQYAGSSWSYVGYNLLRPLFADKRVRTALTRLINRERILDEVYLGLGTIISGPFVPRSPYYNHDVKPLPFDPAEAARILADAGWADTDNDGVLDKDYDGSGTRKPFEFTFIVPSSSSISRRISAIIEQDMIKAKIKVNIKPIEWSVYIQLLENRDFDVCSLGWVGSIEGDPYQIWHGSGAHIKSSSNHVGYSSAEADRLIDLGRRTIDKNERYRIYRQLHQVIAEDQPYTFLIAPTSTVAQSRRFMNAIVYKGGGMDANMFWIPTALQQTR